MPHVTFVNHTPEHNPGDVLAVSDAEARRLTEAAMVRPATDDEVAGATEAAEAAVKVEAAEQSEPKHAHVAKKS